MLDIFRKKKYSKLESNDELRKISERDYMSFVGPKGPTGRHPMLPDEPREWWAGNSRLGLIMEDTKYQDWTYVVLAKNPKDEWQWCAGDSCIDSRYEATQELMKNMKNKLDKNWWL